MPLAQIIASPALWDAHSAHPTPQLLSGLLALPASPLREARLAYVQLMLGQIEEAQSTLQAQPDHPLARATRLAIQVEQHQFAQVVALAQESSSQGLSGEAKARTLLENAKACLHLCQYHEGTRLAQGAALEARLLGMSNLAAVAELLEQDCQTSTRESLDLAEWEAKLHYFLTTAPSQEARVMAYMALVRLLVRRGLYDQAFRQTLEVPKALSGRHFMELMLVVHQLDGAQDWAKLHPWYQGRLHAVKGLLSLDPDLILSGPPPVVEFHPRPLSEWALAFGWAHLKKDHLDQALHYFQNTFIPKGEWDVRFVRDMGLLELYFQAPALVEEHYNLVALAEEARFLLQQRIAAQALLLRLVPRAMPYATAFLLAAPGGHPTLAQQAHAQLLFAGSKGLTLAGVTHSNTQALVRLLSGDTASMNAGALRTNRHRLKLFLQQFNQPGVVLCAKVGAALRQLAQQTEDPEWVEAEQRYRELAE